MLYINVTTFADESAVIVTFSADGVTYHSIAPGVTIISSPNVWLGTTTSHDNVLFSVSLYFIV